MRPLISSASAASSPADPILSRLPETVSPANEVVTKYYAATFGKMSRVTCAVAVIALLPAEVGVGTMLVISLLASAAADVVANEVLFPACGLEP